MGLRGRSYGQRTSHTTRNDDSMQAVWSEEVPAQGIAGHVEAKLLIRAGLPATVDGNQERQVSCTLELFHLAKQVAERTVQIAQDRKPFIVAVDVARRALIQRSFTSSSRGMPCSPSKMVQ